MIIVFQHSCRGFGSVALRGQIHGLCCSTSFFEVLRVVAERCPSYQQENSGGGLVETYEGEGLPIMAELAGDAGKYFFRVTDHQLSIESSGEEVYHEYAGCADIGDVVS